jgi:flagellar motor switch protein FliN
MRECQTTNLRIELGRARIRHDDLAKLRSGSVIALDNPTSGPVNLYAGRWLVARGEPVVVDGRLAVRVLEIEASQETVQ